MSCWSDAFLSADDGTRRQFFLEAVQTLPILVSDPASADVIDAMKMHRIRLSKDQGLRAWEPSIIKQRTAAAVGPIDI